MKQSTLTNTEIADLCLQLALFLRSGALLSDGLYLLAEEEKEGPYRTSLADMAHQMENGSFLFEVFDKANFFPAHIIGLLEVGERVGRTEETLLALARYYEDLEKRNRQLRNALTYPSILLLIMLVVIVVLLTRVLPIFDEVYASLGGSLTGLAGGLLTLGNILSSLMPALFILLAIISICVAVISFLPNLRDKLLQIWNLHWGDRGISRKMNDARFAQALSLALISGLPLEECVTLSGSLLKDCPPAVKRCEICREHLETCGDLAGALSASDMLPAASCRMLMLAMRSGNGDAAMEEIARRLSEEAEDALETRLAQIEPALVLITSILVGSILLTVMLPLMNIMKAIG